MRLTSVVLLEPVPPNIPTVCPDFICRFMSLRTSLPDALEYLKETLSKSIEPSAISFTP